MRKAFAILVLLCLCPLHVWAEAVTDQQTIAEINHAIYESNQLDAIFSRHESVTITFHHPHMPESDEVIWETSELCFRSWSETDAQYIKDNVIYELYNDNGDVDLSCTCVYGAPYSYCFVGDPEEYYYSPEHEHTLDCFEEDGLLYIITEYDESLSRKAMEAVGLEYTGQTVRSRIVVDAETYDIVDFCQYVTEDGNETIIIATHAAYDEPEPFAGRVLRGAFEHTSRNMMNVTYIIDQGTDHEVVRTIAVPANTECVFPSLDVPYIYFDDPECTTISYWDRLSDKTYYIITNPIEEENERFEAAYEAALQQIEAADTKPILKSIQKR